MKKSLKILLPQTQLDSNKGKDFLLPVVTYKKKDKWIKVEK